MLFEVSIHGSEEELAAQHRLLDVLTGAGLLSPRLTWSDVGVDGDTDLRLFVGDYLPGQIPRPDHDRKVFKARRGFRIEEGG